MTKTRAKKNAQVVRNCMTEALVIFGKTLTRRVVTRTVDNWGQLSATSTSDTTFTGDLQFGFDLDQRFIKSGYVEVGDAVLYVKHDVTINPQDQIVDGSSIWEVTNRVKALELEGSDIFFMFRCKRRINSGD